MSRIEPDPHERAERLHRRRLIADSIGNDAIALIAGGTWPTASTQFRQTNEFHYLVEIDTPQSYLTIDGSSGESILYLPHTDPKRVRSEGPLPYVEDSEEVIDRTGVDAVRPIDDLARDLARRFLRPGSETIFTPHAPCEGGATSRDGALAAQAEWASDPWDGKTTREARLISHLRARFPQSEIRDLSPTLDAMRLVKSEVELGHLRTAGRLSAVGVLYAIRATRPGVMEYQLAAMADFVFAANGAQGSGYSAIVAGGSNAWMGHYGRLSDPLTDGDLVLMDYAPDLDHYTSDIGRVWPVNGRFGELDATAYSLVLRYYEEIMAAIRPGRTSDEIHDEVAAIMEPVIDETVMGTPGREAAAQGMLEFRGHLSHPVGMAVHDVGEYRSSPLPEGLVISVDPMMWIEDELGYIRIEDTVVVTADGYENLTSAAPIAISEIEAEVGRDPGSLDRFLDRT